MILWKATVRHYLKHPWQVVLSTVGITLGVAVVVAIDLVNTSASKAFELSTNAITGKATHQITGGSQGVPEEFYLQLRNEYGLDKIAPVVEGFAELVEKKSTSAQEYSRVYQLIGIDVFSERPFRNYLGSEVNEIDIKRLLGEPNTAIISKSTAKRHRIKRNEQINLIISGEKRSFTIIGLLDDVDDFDELALSSALFVDIATAQEVLNFHDNLSRIDIIIDDSPEGKSRLNEIKANLPSNISIVSSSSRNYALAQMTHAFETNLTALSLLALIVGMFLIYNTMTFSVVLRRQIIGVLRALGVSRKEIFRMVFVESMFIGLWATWLGIFFGIILANGLLDLVTQTINDLYFVLNIKSLHVSYASLLKGMLIGLVATAVTGFLPAYEATKSTPRASLARSTLEAKYKQAFTWSKWLGSAIILLGTMVLVIPTDFLPLSFVGLFAIITGFALFVPQLTLFFVNMSVPIHHKLLGTIGNIAARSVASSLSRTSVAIASLTVAIATTIGVAIMIDSFRGSVVGWLDNTLRADVFITTPGVNSSKSKGNLSPRWIERFKSLPEVEALSVVRNVELQAPKGITQVQVLQLPEILFTKFDLTQGNLRESAQGFYQEDAVLVSEPYSYKHDLDVGDMLVLPTDKGLKSFRISGVYVDYGSDQGIVTMNRTTYDRYWEDRTISSIGIHTMAGTNVNMFIDTLQKMVSDFQAKPLNGEQEQSLVIRSNAAVKDASIKVFDRTFVVTEVLRLLAIFVAFVGIVSALMAIQFERRAEIALFRALGLTPQEVWLVVSGETGLIGAIAGVLAIPLGLVLAVVLIFVVNRRSFGWSMEITLDPMLFAQSVLLSITAAMIAGMIPAYKMSKSNPVTALREE